MKILFHAASYCQKLEIKYEDSILRKLKRLVKSILGDDSIKQKVEKVITKFDKEEINKLIDDAF